MSVRIEKSGHVWTIIHSRSEARNGMDPKSAQDLVDAFMQFENDPDGEFDDFKWVSYWYPLHTIVSFKKDVYRKLRNLA